MPNLAISHIDSNIIIDFLVDCRKVGKLFKGSLSGPTKSKQFKFEKFNLVWTEDMVEWEIVAEEFVFNKTIDQLIPCESCLAIEEISHEDENIALQKLKIISGYNYSQIDTFVDSNDPTVILKVYGKVLLGLCKLVFKLIK